MNLNENGLIDEDEDDESSLIRPYPLDTRLFDPGSSADISLNPSHQSPMAVSAISSSNEATPMKMGSNRNEFKKMDSEMAFECKEIEEKSLEKIDEKEIEVIEKIIYWHESVLAQSHLKSPHMTIPQCMSLIEAFINNPKGVDNESSIQDNRVYTDLKLICQEISSKMNSYISALEIKNDALKRNLNEMTGKLNECIDECILKEDELNLLRNEFNEMEIEFQTHLVEKNSYENNLENLENLNKNENKLDENLNKKRDTRIEGLTENLIVDDDEKTSVDSGIRELDLAMTGTNKMYVYPYLPK